jgi:peptide chain release factor 1
VSEGGGGGGISQIISGHVDGLDGGDGTLLGGGNSLLESTKIGGEGGLVTDGRGNTTEEGRHLRASLGESEDVVDEKQHILVLLVTEVLGNGETGETNSGTGAGGLVHLTVHEGGLGSWSVNLDHTGLDHFMVKIITFSGTLTDTGEH